MPSSSARLGCVVVAAFVLARSPWASAATSDKPRQPNVVVIIADDLGWADVGYHGSEIRTPNLDQMAEAGVRMEQYYVFPTCSPTRTAILTGRNPSRFGVWGPIGGRSEQVVPPDTTTLADVLHSLGYTTAQVGKWHLSLRPETGPLQYGFDTSYGFLHGQIDPYTHYYKNGDRTWHRNDKFMDEEGHATDLLTTDAVRVIETPRSQPFFLYLAYSVPHTPLNEPSQWTEPYAASIASESRRKFAASVTHMDASIGQVLAALDRTGQRDNTLVVFTSDNGGQHGEEKSENYGGRYDAVDVLGSNTPLRGWKGETYEGGIRVPALVVWPGTLSPRSVTLPTSALDWLPTIAAITGAKVSPDWHWEGKDILAELNGTGDVGPRRLYWNTSREAALRDGDWKLIEFTRGKQPSQLFNLAADPNEKTDEASAHPEIVKRLAALLAEEKKRDE
ncbi:MAG TPA: sulfatase-like hydrolase/transferase [Pirellulales bacterium]|jgi:arylsulfatase A-like enzyme|nr:sulfatase-like hydrolase/transferase [Pirellulales bacterium]